jgi:FlaG/FlaF family flagellin (archaellin)
MRNEEAVKPIISVILIIAITVILAAVIVAFIFAVVTTPKIDMADIKVVNVTVNNMTVIIGGFGYSQTNEVFFENGDRIIFGKGHNADVSIGENVEFEKLVFNNHSYQMTYQRVGPSYQWTLTNVTEVDK